MSPEHSNEPSESEQPMSVGEIIRDFVGDETLMTGIDSLSEQEREQRVAEVDAANAVLVLQEEIDDLQKRARAGEQIDPNHRKHLQELLLEAHVRFIKIHGPPA